MRSGYPFCPNSCTFSQAASLGLWSELQRMGQAFKTVVARTALAHEAVPPAIGAQLSASADPFTPTGADFRATPLIKLPDAELVARSRNGDTSAYGELVNRYQFSIRNLARSMARECDAEDLAQETFVKGFLSLQNLKEAHKFGPWLFTILRHTALDLLRSSKDNVSLETLLEDGFEPKERIDGAAIAAMEAHEEDQHTLNALRTLRDDYREIIILKHVHQLSYKQIGQRLGMSVSAVGEKLSRVRALLKRRIEKKPVS